MGNFNINQPVRRPIEELETELAMQNGLVKLNELGEKPAPKPDFSIDHLLPKSTQKGTSAASWDISMGAVYDRKADGSYTPKFENYKTAYGNEDRLAREQGSLEMIGRGAGRLVSKAGMYALDAVVGTATGIFEALDKKELSGIWDNSFSNWVDDVNKTLDRNLAVYHTDEYNNKNILQQVLSSPLVFATSDLADGLAFVGGALLPELAIGILSGGASMPTSFAKLGARTASLTAKKAAKEAGKATAKKAASLTRLNNLTRAGELAGNPLKTAGFLIRSSNFEASVEARHNFHDSIETYMSEFERLNGRAPNKEELTSFTELAKTTANGVWKANMAILSLSNLAMFGKTFGIAPKTFAGVRSVENRILGLTPKRAGEGLLEVIKPTRGQRIFGNAYKILSKPMVEGLYEEGLQGVAGQTMQNYLKSTYDDSMGDYYDVYSALSEGFAHTYGTKEGWKEIGLGMIIGSLGGVMQGQGPAGTFSDSYGRAVKNMNKSVEEANIAFGQSAESIQRRAKAASSANRFKNRIEKGESIDPTLEDSFVALNFVRSQEGLKTHEEIQNEYNTLVDNTEFEVEDEGGTQYDKESMEEYKTKLKEDFSNTLKDYKKAKNTFTRLGLNKEVIKTSTGNMALLQDYLVSGMVMAEKAQRSGKEVGKTIEKYLGKDGIYNAMTFFSNLKESQKEKVSELRESKVKLTEYEKDLQKLTKELAGLTEVTDPSKQVELRRNEIAEKRLLISQQILELENSIQENEALLEKETSTDGFGLEKDPLEFSEFESASSNIEKLNQLDSYLTVMRQSGKEVEAEYLENLIEQFKTYTDVKHEMDNTIRRMADNKFLTSNKFKGWLSSTVLGKSYSMSEDFKSALRENNEKIDTQLNKVGIRQGESVEDLMKKYLEKNDKISDREKYRLETIIRLTLTIDSVVGDMNRNLNTDVVQAEKETSSSIPEGDTIRLKRSLGLTEDNVTTIDILDKAINDIVEAVEEVRQRVKGQKESATEQQDTEEVTTETTESEVEETEEVEQEEEQTAPQQTESYRVIDTEDFKKMEALQNKLYSEGELTEEEQEELGGLEESVDQWTFATGTIVEGYRLSDLIRLRNQLKSTPIAERGLIEIPDPITKAARGNFKDIENSPNYQNAQQPSHVTAKSSGNNIVLSGLSYEDLAQIAGEDFPTENVEGDYESLRGNTVISMETKRKLDEGGKLIINPPRSTSFNYSIVLQQLEDGTYVPLTSDFASKGFNGPGADFKSVYQVKVDDKVELTVDTKDEKNQELLEAYRNATDEESKAKAIEDLKTSLVIRTNIGGVFNGFLKAKRETGENKTDTDKKFEEMRDSLINNEAFLDRLLDTTIEQDVPMNGGVTVSKVYLGHPNFNFVKGADGMFGVEARPFTKENSKNVKDIGYMLDGKMVTRSGERTEEAIDTTFLGDKGKLEKGVKLPFVVFELNGKKIAYPVDVAELTKPDNTEMRDIFESQEISNEMKVEKLNKLLAGRGVDIKERGRAFTFQNIHDQEFFDNIFGIVDSLSYFYNLKDWVNKDISIQDVLSQQALIDINLAEPFIAPKMSMDFSKMTPIKAGTKVKPAAPKSKGSTGGKKGKVAKDEVNKKCPK
jgi:hypothetical protein